MGRACPTTAGNVRLIARRGSHPVPATSPALDGKSHGPWALLVTRSGPDALREISRTRQLSRLRQGRTVSRLHAKMVAAGPDVSNARAAALPWASRCAASASSASHVRLLAMYEFLDATMYESCIVSTRPTILSCRAMTSAANEGDVGPLKKGLSEFHQRGGQNDAGASDATAVAADGRPRARLRPSSTVESLNSPNVPRGLDGSQTVPSLLALAR